MKNPKDSKRKIRDEKFQAVYNAMGLSSTEALRRLREKRPEDAKLLAAVRQAWKDFDGGLSPI